jgi:adenosine deaminase
MLAPLALLVAYAASFDLALPQWYLDQRAELIDMNDQYRFSNDMLLSPADQELDNLLRAAVHSDYSAPNPSSTSPPTLHPYLPDGQFALSSSATASLLRGMPKGGVLHVHALAQAPHAVATLTGETCFLAVDPCQAIGKAYEAAQRATTQEAAAAAMQNNLPLLQSIVGGLRFANEAPSATGWSKCASCATGETWKTLFTMGPLQSANETVLWEFFDTKLGIANIGLASAPVVEAGMHSWLDLWAADGVSHVEWRLNGNFTDADGNPMDRRSTMELVQKKLADYTGNVTVRIIVDVVRGETQDQVLYELVDTANVMPDFPDLLVGFDVDDEEDRFHTLYYYAAQFIQYADRVPYFFHVGETRDFRRDYSNLYDALLLNSSRLGHAYSLAQYPYLMQVVRDSGTPIELCVLSNQILHELDDLRNHPGRIMLANGLQVSLTPDDPMVYNYTGVTPDFVAATIAFNLTVADLKQLAYNSINTSALDEATKTRKLSAWADAWNAWVKATVGW